MSSNKRKGRFGATEYILSYTVIMIAVVTILFLFFPPLKDFMHGWFPTDWVRYVAIFLIVALVPLLLIGAVLSRGSAMGFFLLFKMPTKQYSKRDVARYYFLFGVGAMAILLLAIFFIFGGSI